MDSFDEAEPVVLPKGGARVRRELTRTFDVPEGASYDETVARILSSTWVTPDDAT